MSSYKNFVKPGTLALQSTRVLGQLRERIQDMHYSLSTEQVYVYWVRVLCCDLPGKAALQARWMPCLSRDNDRFERTA